MNRKTLILLVINSVGLLCAQSVYAQVMIAEVMPDTTAPNDKSEWLELYNYSAGDVDLGGWQVDGETIPTGLSLPPATRLVITKDIAAFTTEFGNVEQIAQLDISLPNAGSSVDLLNTAGAVIDTFTYANSIAGKSWQRAGKLCDEMEKATPTPASQNINHEAACFAGGFSPFQIQFSLDSKVWQSSITAIGPVKIYTRVDPAPDSAFELVDQQSQPVPKVWEVQQYIGKVSLLQAGQLKVASPQLTIFPKLKISEFMPDPAGTDAGSEWVEVHNPNDFGVDLAGLQIFSGGTPGVDLASKILAPDAFLQIILPKSILLNCTAAGCQDNIELKMGDLVVDSVSYSETQAGQSWSLDAAGSWQAEWQVTPGKENMKQEEIPAASASSRSSSSSSSAQVISSVKVSGVLGMPASSSYGSPMLEVQRLPTNSLPPMQDDELGFLSLVLFLASLLVSLLTALYALQPRLEKYVRWWVG